MGTTGNKGRFAERLKKIIFRKRKKQIKKEEDVVVADSKTIYANFLKVTAAVPLVVYGSLKNTPSKDDDLKNDTLPNDNVPLITDAINENKKIKANRQLQVEKIKTIDVEKIKEIQKIKYGQEEDQKKHNFHIVNIVKNSDKTVVNREKLEKQDLELEKQKSNLKKEINPQKLEKEILNIIKKRLIKIVNELEILQSELYIINEVNGSSVKLKECQEELNKVKNILCKIDKLKEQYDFLKDNYDFEYLLEIDDDNLVDKIIELRDAFGNNELKAVSADYKLLDAYRYLYLKIDDLQEKTAEFEKNKEEEVLKLKERDINFDKLKNDVYNVDSTKRNYEYFIETQNNILKELDENVNKITSHEEVDYHLRGFNRLFFNSFKYFGLLMLSPLKGIIPSIATETLLTGNLIKNLRKDLKWEEERKIVYDAIDYSSLINNAINDLDGTARIVDMTLEEIVQLKIRYNEQFKKYQGDISEYRDIMHKINDMENKILGNKIKVEIMRQRTLEQERLNSQKLLRVKKLNS